MDVQGVVRDCGVGNQGLATRQRLKGAGLKPPRLSAEVARGAVVRIHRRVYGLAPLPLLPKFTVTDRGVSPQYVVHVRAALLSLGSAATACGRTAAALRGWALFVEPARTVEVAVEHGRSRVEVPHVRVKQRRAIEREELVVLEGTEALWTTTAPQTVLDCALALPLVEGVVVADSALRSGQLSLDELVAVLRSARGKRDLRRARRVLELCDPQAGSVLESVLRVRMVLAGVEGFASQVTLKGEAGQHVLRVDFCFADTRLVVEVDGQKWHQDVERDRRLDNQLAILGWRVLRYSWADVVHEPERVLAEIAGATGCPTLNFQFDTDTAPVAA